MIKRTTLNFGDVLVITDKNGVEIMALSLTELQGDNELLPKSCKPKKGSETGIKSVKSSR